MPKRKADAAPPRRGKRTRVYRRRRVKNRRIEHAKVPRTRFSQYKDILATKLRTQMNYCDTVMIGPGSSSARHVFRMGSIYDPDYTASGHQPFAHDQWQALYSYYRVYGFAYEFKFRPRRSEHHDLEAAGGTATGELHPVVDSSHADQYRNPAICFVEHSEASSGGFHFTETTDKNTLRERGPSDKYQYRVTNARPYATYTIKGFKRLKDVMTDPLGSSTPTAFGSNPTDGYYICAGVMSIDGNTTGTYVCEVKLTYFVEMSEPLDVDGS